MSTRWKGSVWIKSPEDFEFLKSVGIENLDPVDIDGECTCEMSDDVLRALDKEWGRFYWSLTPILCTDSATKVGGGT